MKVILVGGEPTDTFMVEAKQQNGFVRIYVNGVGVIEIIERPTDKPTLAICNGAHKVLSEISNYTKMTIAERGY